MLESLTVSSVELENVNGSWVEKSTSPYNIGPLDIKNDIGSKPEDYKVTNEKTEKSKLEYNSLTEDALTDRGVSLKTAKAIMKAKTNDGLEEIENHTALHNEMLKYLTGTGRRIGIKTLEDIIKF